MKHIALKGGIIMVALSILLSYAPKSNAQELTSQQWAPQNNVIIHGKYSYDMSDNAGGFTTKTGNFNINYQQYSNNPIGYDFYNRQNTTAGNGTIYLGLNNGQPYLYGSNNGSIYRLSKPLAVLPDASTNWYSFSGIPAVQQGVYAVYDRNHDIYIRMMIAKIEYPTYPTPNNQKPVVLQPTENTYINQSQGNLAISWVPYNYASSYSLRMQCQDPKSRVWKENIDYISGASYTYNVSRIPADYQDCQIFVSAVAQNGQRSGYPVRNFHLNYPAPVFTNPKNYETIYASYNTVINWTSVPGTSSYGVEMICETCSKPWSKIFLVNGSTTSVNIKNRLTDLPDSNQRIKIRVKRNDSNSTLSDPLYLTVIK